MNRWRHALVLLIVVLVAFPAGARGYRPAVTESAMTFPVARSRWFSVINFGDDWHAPRMRFFPSLGRWRQVGVHEGNDIYAEPGTPIRAVLGGRVENLGWLFYSGWRVGIRGDDGRYWFYAHMSRYAPGLAIGQRVESGVEIGAVGNTGYGNRPGHKDEFTYHVHVGLQATDGRWVNPYPLMRRLYSVAVRGS
jgi:murein DD-endopeptidase MepM/ murein hydrolase activator NlpD